jgi:regulatory protein
LAVRPRSRRELELRLLRAGFEADEVADVLARLEGVGLVDDEDFARRFAEHQFGSRLAGARAVAGALAAKGIAQATIASALSEAEDDESSRAERLARARAARMSALEPAKAFARLVSLLTRRGYPFDVARAAALRALAIEAPDE